MQTLLSTKHLQKQYGELAAVNDITFSLNCGEFVCIMGASGSGKSTLLNLIATIDNPTQGTILIDGEDLSLIKEKNLAEFRRNNLGFVFQEYNLLDTLTLRENIALSLIIRKTDKKTINDNIDNIAKKLGILNLLDKYPYEISGGQRQRCAVARAIAGSPKLILADEPTGALDSSSAKHLMEAFAQLNEEMNATLLMVTHDAFSACYCSRILFMKDGKIIKELFKNNMTNQAFFHIILDTLAENCGGDDFVC